MLKFLDYLVVENKIKNESVLDPDREHLDPTIFSEPLEKEKAQLLDTVRIQIFKSLQYFSKVVPLKGVYLIGSILTYHYDEEADLDVTLVIDSKHEDKHTDDLLFALIEKLNGQLVPNTKHPINFYYKFLDDKGLQNYIYSVADDIVDIVQNKWLKASKDNWIDIDKYMLQFDKEISKIDLKLMKLRRNIIDLDRIQRFDIETKKKLKDLIINRLAQSENEIEELYNSYEGIHKARQEVFKKDYSLEELKRIHSKNLLPENIIYKLVSRYYYNELIIALKSTLDKDGKLNKYNIRKVKNDLNDFLTK